MKKQTARNIALGLTLAATAFAGTAYAEQAMRGEGVTLRSDVQARTAAMFARMDANKDGKLDKADREARRAAMFDRLDSDKNGQISRAEFSARPQRPDGAAKGPDGEPGKHRGWGKRGGGHRGGHHGGMMMGRFADANKDGAVTQAEFTAAALKRFDAMDANKDGKATTDERQAARKAMRDEWRARREAAKPAS